MANIPSVAKRARQALKRRDRNASLRAELRTMKKNMQKLLDAGDAEGIRAKTPHALRLFDKMVTKGIIHRNNAARSKSRLMKKVWSLVPDFQLVSIKTPKAETKVVAKTEVAKPAKATKTVAKKEAVADVKKAKKPATKKVKAETTEESSS